MKMQSHLEQLAPFLALYLAHLLGDFPLQTKGLVAGKREGSAKAYGVHIIVHLVLSSVALLFFSTAPFLHLSTVLVLGTLAVGHLGLDLGKSRLLHRWPKHDSWVVFVADQLLHVSVILIATGMLPGVTYIPLLEGLWPLRFELLARCLILALVVFPAGYLIRYLLKPLGDQLPREKPLNEPEGRADDGLDNAGLFLGWIERALLLFGFAQGSVTAIGLIVGAKSVARFPEFKNRAFAEYFLIGTLLSVSFAALGGILWRAVAGT